MLKSIAAATLALLTLSQTVTAAQSEATHEELPYMIDFSRFKASIFDYGYYEKESLVLGYYAFNYAPEMGPLFGILKRDYKIDAAIETGTFRGGTTAFFAILFDEVHTIEISDHLLNETRNTLKNFRNIQYHLGSSDQVLKDLLPTLKNKTLLVYLDAHWYDFWPLLDELAALSKTHKDNCVVVIDDFKVPGRNDIPYDAYGKHECSYEYVKPLLDQLYSQYTIHYVIPKTLACRAKLVVTPKNIVKP